MSSLSDMFLWYTEKIRKKGLEGVADRFYGIYQCIVVDNKDEQKRGRIRVKGSIFPGSKDGTGVWIPPKSYYTGANHGMFFPPEEESYVFISFVDGDSARPFYDGGFWTESAGKSKVPFDDTQTTSPSIRGIKTSTGFEVIFSEQNDENSTPFFKIITPKGNMILCDDKDDSESIKLLDKEGNEYFSNKEGISISDKFENSYVSTENGIVITDKNGNKITKDSSGVTIDVNGDANINATGNCTVTSPNVKITGGKATIGGTVAPTGSGAFCGIPVCIFSGAPHTGPTSTGT